MAEYTLEAQLKLDMAQMRRDLDKVQKDISDKVGNALGTGGKGLGKEVKGALGFIPGGGIGAGAGSGPAAGILAGVTAGVALLNKLKDIQQQALETMSKSSGLFKTTRDLLQKSWNHMIRPFGDFIGIVFRPLAFILMRQAKEFIKASKPILEGVRTGTIGVKEGSEQLMSSFQEFFGTALDEAGLSLQEFIGIMNKFGVSTADDLAGIVSYFEGSLESIAASLGATVADIIGIFKTDMIGAGEKIVDAAGNIEGAGVSADEMATELAGAAESAGLASDALGQIPQIIQDMVGKEIAASLVVSSIERGMEDAIRDMEKYGVPKSTTKEGFDDFISRPGQSPVSFSPQDTIIGMKSPGALGGGGNQTITVTINNPMFNERDEMERIVEEVSSRLGQELRANNTYY